MVGVKAQLVGIYTTVKGRESCTERVSCIGNVNMRDSPPPWMEHQSGVRCIGLNFRSLGVGHTQRQSFRAFSTFRVGNFLVGKNEGRRISQRESFLITAWCLFFLNESMI